MTLREGERWRVIQGDCLEVMPEIDRVDHVITDPPYEAEAHTKGRRVLHNGVATRIEATPLTFAPLTEALRGALAHEWARLARRWVLTWCQIEAVGAWRDALVEAGLSWRRGGVWAKRGMPQLTGDRPAQGCECVAIAHAPGRSRWNGGGTHALWDAHHQDASETRVHETQKPLSLMLELVSLFTDPGDLVLDPFCGSGTTGVACLRLGRRFIGIEKDEKYAAVAQERLEAEDRGLNLRDVRAGQTSIFDALEKP